MMHIHGGDTYTHQNVIDFSANINFKGMPAAVAEAAKQGVDLGAGYPDTKCRILREAIGQREGVAANHIICGNGAADLIFSLVLAVKPRKALLTAPSFYEYEQALISVNCWVEKYGLQERNGFQIQEDFLERITPETDLVFLCNPNNPTGVLIEREFLGKVLKRCERCRAYLVLDECFIDFIDEPDRYTMKDFLTSSDQLFLLKAYTKMYAMAGLRLGYGMSSSVGLISRMNRVTQPWNVSTPAQLAGIAAASEVSFVEESRREIREEREKLKQELINMGHPVLGSAANFIFFQGPRGLYESCLTKGFLIRDCSNYEGLTTGWYRIAVRSEAENRALIEAMKDIY